jgi:hypothetical protein
MSEYAINHSCFDRLSTNGSWHTSTDFSRLNHYIPIHK